MYLKTHKFQFLLFAILLSLSALIYLPGISGPYVFDDYSNLLSNTYVHLHSLNVKSIKDASFSLAAGPLRRPVAMFSFALNYYLAGGFNHSSAFKLVNLAIHAINGLLIFWLSRLIFARLAQLPGYSKTHAGINRYAYLYPAAVALLWQVHPIQLTSVLYVVQRMNELSALFTLLGLIFYFKGRARLISGQHNGTWLILLGLFGFGALGIFSKENAVLLPVFAATLEFVLFPDETPWRSWSSLSPNIKRALIACVVSGMVLLLALVVYLALPGYSIRHFTMAERLITEPRVLFFYISLILVPRINEFGLLHDDIPISTSLLTPWTTLPSLIGIVALFVLAVHYRRKYPLLSLGLLWFFSGQLLESTFIPLEIAHEHRNYLASYGILLAVIYLIDHVSLKLTHRWLWWLVPLMAVVFAGTTIIRASEWSNINNFYQYEALHHPRSPGDLAGLATLRNLEGNYKEAIALLRRASELDKREAAFLLGIQMMAAEHGVSLPASDQAETLRRLTAGPLSATAGFTLNNIDRCIFDSCRSLQVPMETWLTAIIGTNISKSEASFYYYLLGHDLQAQEKYDGAIKAYATSYQYDRTYLIPLIQLADLYLQLNQLDNAQKTLSQLRAANAKNLHPRDAEIQKLEIALVRARNQAEINRQYETTVR